MSDISLRAYVDYIQDRLERDAFSEVVAQCRHVLQARPKYIEVYKLLARALLEQENYQDATDLFQRVLSADPNDFVAHIGISECYHESAAIDQAIWHLERAFEQVPSNADLQEEIKRLYTERDGSAPRRVQLTAGALARLYMNGQLYPQAILELRKAVEADSNRPDLLVLLAEALWQNHQEVEAGELAAAVLKRLPNSLDANRILARLWLRAGQPDEAAPFLERLEGLDPYLAYSVRHDGQPAPAEAFRLPMLEYTAERHASEVGAAEWVSQIQSVEKVESATAPLTGALVEQQAVSEATAASAGGSDIPDWLQGAYAASLENVTGEETPTGPPQPPPAVEAAPAPSEDTGGLDWLPELLGGSPEAGEEPEGEAPDWLNDILGDTSPLASQEAPSAPEGADDEIAEPEDEAPRPSTDPLTRPAPDWLADALGESGAESSAHVVEPAGGEEPAAPDWLDDILSGRDVPTEPGDGPTGEPTPGVVSTDWLDGLIGGAAESTASEDLLDGQTEPEWPAPKEDPTGSIIDFGELEPWDTDPLPELEDPLATRLLDTAAPEADDAPPGETGPVTGTQSDTDAQAEDEALPAWLRPEEAGERAPVALREEQQVTLPNDDPMGEDSSQDIPDWLSEGDLDSDEAIDWLEELAAKYDPDFESAQPGDEEAAGEGEAESEELPEWLSGTPERAAEESMPSWLLEEDEEELVEAPEAQIEVEPEEEGFPDWLTGAPAPAAEASAGEKEEPFSLDFEDEEEEPAAAAPSWRRAVSELEEEEEELPDWLGRAPSYEAGDTAGEEDEDSLDWLTEPSAGAAEPEPVDEAGEEEEELPAWMSGEPAEPVAPAAAAPAPEEEPEIPEWLKRRSRGYEEEEDDLAWLDEQVEAQGVSPDEPLAEALTTDQLPVAAPEPVDEAEEAEPVGEGEMPSWFKDIEAREEMEAVSEEPVEDLDAELLEAAALDADLDDLSWLDSALEAEEITVSEDDIESLFGEVEHVRGEIPAVEEPEPEAEAEAEEEEELEEAPTLAAGAAMPDWLTPAPAAPAEAEAEAEEAAEPEAVEEAEPAEAEAAEEAEPEMPEWLKEAGPVAEVEAGDEIEEAVAAAEQPEPEMPEWLKEAVAPAAEVTEAAEEPEAEEAEVAEPVAEAPAAPAVSADERLSTAREKLPLDFGEAVPIYEGLIAEGEKLEQTAADLDYYLRSTSKPDPRARRILGDAYREQGKLQEALDAYRAALDEL